MPTPAFIRIDESIEFTWPWSATKGLLVVTGASGGGGGGIGGQGYEEGQEGGDGPNGFVIFVPLGLDSDGEEQ
ncbi:MAG: hypothetical protein OXG15_00880 [Gammaproteobacteria bacterium]|nr:hypothetical protein [Gammaproteobacteria bacterium]